MARIVELLASDTHVRRVKVRTADNKTWEKDRTKLVLLEMDTDEEERGQRDE